MELSPQDEAASSWSDSGRIFHIFPNISMMPQCAIDLLYGASVSVYDTSLSLPNIPNPP